MPPDVPLEPAVTRRMLARGVAWTAPVVVTAVAAPAFATSPGAPLQVEWTYMKFVGSHEPGLWLATFTFTNTSPTSTVKVTQWQLITTYLFPAANTTPGQVVLTSTNDVPTLAPGATVSEFPGFLTDSDFQPPPTDAGANNIGTTYYCGNACGLMLDGGTVLRFTYTVDAGPAQVLDVAMTDQSPCYEDVC